MNSHPQASFPTSIMGHVGKINCLCFKRLMDTSLAWEAFESGEYELAKSRWVALLSSAQTQKNLDSFNWGLGYTLVKLGKFLDAKKIWEEIFSRTKDHKALHQVGMVERESGSYSRAFEIYLKESELIDDSDVLSKAVNLYELSFCSHLKGDAASARRYLDEYRKYTGNGGDLIEEACFLRLEGDIFSKVDSKRAIVSYEASLGKFLAANDEVGASEIRQRLEKLNT